MSEYQIRPGKIGEAVIGAYKKVEAGVVNGCKKVEAAFADRFLEKAGEPPEDGAHGP